MIFVVAERHGAGLNRASIEAVAAAQRLQDPVTVVWPCGQMVDVPGDLTALDVASVMALQADGLASYTADGYVTALAAYVRQAAPTLVLLPHTYQTRDFAPRLAARLDRTLVTDCVALAAESGRVRFTRPLFQGKVHADVVVDEPAPWLATIQIGAYRADAARAGAAPAPVQTVAADLDPAAIRQQAEPPFREARQAVDLSQADRIVAVGRGIKEQAHIALAERLATALGAELAASRPICDAGWLPMDRQIGSSGQTVAPRLYVALGISGAIQHIVGMKGSKTIVAVNKDPDAPIFEVADYGIVGDLFDVIPALVAALQ